jgi:A/G-specific adenine glycosylase
MIDLMSEAEKSAFQQVVWEYYGAHGRHDLPWRQAAVSQVLDPYKIVVSELMLQQTQVQRVLPKFTAFMATFPDFTALAAASLAAVLQAWSGLGYNRRAKFLWQTAQQVVHEHHGHLPHTREELVRLPGIGPNTAGAILAYAYDQPVVFIETNIRTVFIHHFFANHPEKVSDKMVEALVRDTLPDARSEMSPREWYWALMDYGTWLKQTVGNLSRASTVYAKQSKFQGSRRQIRGHVLRLLGQAPHTLEALKREIPDERLSDVLASLRAEGFIQQHGSRFCLAGA